MAARNKSLDVLRAIAVFMTFGRHMVQPDEANLPGVVYKVLRTWFKTGWAGVTLFFVLSGFLISSLMFNEFLNTGDIRFGRLLRPARPENLSRILFPDRLLARAHLRRCPLAPPRPRPKSRHHAHTARE